MTLSLTLILVVINCLVSYMAFNNRAVFDKLKHSPYMEHRDGDYLRLLTSGFVHGSWGHLLINMFVLWQFGEMVEYRFIDTFGATMGRVNYLLVYLLTIVFANVGTFLKHKDNPGFASVGASGAVSGIIFIFCIWQPWAMLLLFFVIPCPAIIAAILFLVYSSWASKNSNDFIDHDAHFYGAVFGFAFTLLLKPSLFSVFMERLLNNTPF